MDFTNINDPAGVKALLDQLGSSQAWQELSSDASTANHASNTAETVIIDPPSPAPPLRPEPEPEPLVSEHISSLLSRLQPGGSDASAVPSRPALSVDAAHDAIHQDFTFTSSSRPQNPGVNSLTLTPIRASSPQARSTRTMNFNQALPVIGRLSENPTFMENLEKMQKDQACLERKLWEQRSHILKAQEEKVKVAQAKAAIVGAGLSQSDASSLISSFQKELKAFDSEQVLPAWDALVVKQQRILEALGVPGMFVTTAKADKEKQQRIVQVLGGLTGSGDEDMES